MTRTRDLIAWAMLAACALGLAANIAAGGETRPLNHRVSYVAH